MVSQRGIEANLDKIQAILNTEPPKNVKEIQSLTRRVAALNKFVSKATNKCLPFFKVLRKAFEWTDECQKAFQDLKVYLTTAPLLSPSIQGEELYLLSSVPICGKFSIDQERREGAEACILYKPSAKGSKRMISDDGKVGICINNSFQEAEALLLGPCHQCHYRSCAQEGDEQVGSCRTTNPMGH